MNRTDHKILIIIFTIISTIFIIISSSSGRRSSSYEYFVASSFVADIHIAVECLSSVRYSLISRGSSILVCIVVSKCSRKLLYFWEIQNSKSFKPHFLQDSPLVQLCTSGRKCTRDGNIPGSHFVKAFQLFRRIYSDVSGITKAPHLQF